MVAREYFFDLEFLVYFAQFNNLIGIPISPP